MENFCNYVDVFYGNGEVDHFHDEGIGSKWFYIKALCGNTNPHAVLPFGGMSVGAYSGGYPTGYGTHYPNSCAGVKKFSDKILIKGFTHLHHSGTGGIGYYYNYALTTPFYGEVLNIYNYYPMDNENASPGYYATEFNNVVADFTVTNFVAIHRYKFKNDGGRIAVNFGNDGLLRDFSTRFWGIVSDGNIKCISKDIVTFSGVFSGIKLYFAVKIEAQNSDCKPFLDKKEYSSFDNFFIPKNSLDYGCIFDFDGNDAILKVAYSTVSTQKAIDKINAVKDDFSTIKNNAQNIWNDHLSKIQIDCDDFTVKQKFYSNLYHTLIKPMDIYGEELLGVKGDVITDISTFWDTYKTVFPLLFMLYKDFGEKSVNAILNMSDTLKKIPCSIGLTDKLCCEEQAKMLALYVLLDAYNYGVKTAHLSKIESVFMTELNRDDFKIFLQNGIFERYTHILDVTDICFYLSKLTNDVALKNLLNTLSKNWINAYGKDGLMSESSQYYEGDKYTYSFRLQANIDERISLVNGKKEYEKLLDAFFGFGKTSIKQITDVDAAQAIFDSHHHRFEGFNNECDMETPYSYIYVGRHDKLCEILHECVNYSFTLGKGGLPGNNDSGGLSSCFLFNYLGIFPIAGSGKFLLGAPSCKKATINLFNGKKLVINAHNLSNENYFVQSVYVNGNKVSDFTVSCNDIFNGCVIDFYMQNQKKKFDI